MKYENFNDIEALDIARNMEKEPSDVPKTDFAEQYKETADPRKLALIALGQANSFDMLDPDTDDPKGEIQAARETGAMLAKNLKKIIDELGGSRTETQGS